MGGRLYSLVVIAALASCSTRDPSTLDPGVPGYQRPSSASCAPPTAGCPCTTPGEKLDCGEVVRRSGDYVTCSMGVRTCEAGTWGACVGDSIAIKSLGSTTLGDGGTLTTQSLQATPSPCNNDPCDPACTSYSDNATGLDAGAGLAVGDAGGLTLAAADGSACSNLQCFQVACGNNTTTTLSGKIVAGTQAPFGTPDPVPNVLVYVPNTQVQPFTPGVQCSTSCSADVSGNPLVLTTTAADGTFTLNNVPYGSNIPVVVQLGRWRRQLSFVVNQCAPNIAGTINLPRNQSEGDIPLTAIDTGSSDSMECVLLKMGVDASEFTDPTGGGRIHVYKFNGAQVDITTPPEVALTGDLSTMNRYDQILLPCEGAQYDKSAYQANLVDYTSSGGHAFATHYSYTWLYDVSPFSLTASWAINTQAPASTTAQIDTSFSTGQLLATWLGLVGGLTSTSPAQFAITSPRQDIATGGVNAPAVGWINNADPLLGGGWPLHYTFETPFNAGNTCGRVVFSDFHVADTPSGGTTFPAECTVAPMTAQEKVLEFLLFDLASCGDVVPALVPPYPSSVTFTRDYEGACGVDEGPRWRFFDWQTVTPSDSSIVFSASQATTQVGLATATPVVWLGTASGPPITTWTGADVGAALAPAPSTAWLRITVQLNPSSDHYSAPTLTAWRQSYDCVPNQ